MDHQQCKRRILAQIEGPVHLFQRLRRKRNVGIQRRGKHVAPGAHAASGKRLLGERFLGTADRADELVHHDGLDQILPRAQLHGLLRIAEIRIGAQDDDHGLVALRLHGLKHADAVQLRHAHVHQRQVWPFPKQQFYALAAVFSLAHDLEGRVGFRQEAVNALPNAHLVFHDDDFQACSSFPTGSRRMIRVPSSSSLSTLMRTCRP